MIVKAWGGGGLALYPVLAQKRELQVLARWCHHYVEQQLLWCRTKRQDSFPAPPANTHKHMHIEHT